MQTIAFVVIGAIVLGVYIFGKPKICAGLFGPGYELAGSALCTIIFSLVMWDIGGPLFGLVSFASSAVIICKFLKSPK